MKTNNPVIRQSTYRVNDEADATDGAPRQTAPAMTTPRRIRREARPPRGDDPDPVVPATSTSSSRKDDGVTKVRLQGVRIKTDYTVKEVLTITGDAFSKPFTTLFEWVGNAGSLLIDGRPATQEQKEQIRKFTETFDSVAGAAGAGSIQTVGKMVHHIRDAVSGKMPSRDEMMANLSDGVSMTDVVIPRFNGKLPSRPGLELMPSGGGTNTSGQKEPPSQAEETSGLVQKRLAAQVPARLTPARNRAEDEKRIDAFSAPATFYRKDRQVSNMDFPAAFHASEYKDRNGVLTVGKGKDLTSYNPEMKAYLNVNSPDVIDPELANADVIDLGSGKDGTAAIDINFSDLAKGSTTIVTGGHMRGSTMLFTADDSGFHAYHAQVPKNSSAKASEAAASSIAAVHDRFDTSDTLPAKSKAPENGFDALFRAASRHPFSAVVYSYDDPSNSQPHPKYGPTADVGVSANGNPWSMLNFNYLAPDRNSREVGTANAVITKDMNGKVTVRVLAERGKLENKNPDPTGKPPRNFSYRRIEGATGSYTVPGESLF